MSRSIPEILGWELLNPDSPPFGIPLWCPPDSIPTYEPPSVDDMLVWLRSQLQGRDCILINVGISPGYADVLVRVLPAQHDDPVTNHYGSTLQEALCAAVRAVAAVRVVGETEPATEIAAAEEPQP